MPERGPSPALSALPPIPYSPTISHTSTALPSNYHFPLPPPPPTYSHAILSAANLEASQNAYSALLQCAKAYRLSLSALSASASKFGSALETCARLKEARNETLEASPARTSESSWHAEAFELGRSGECTADTLLAAAGVHQLIANHQQILSETIYKNFEVPLLHELDQWQRRLEDEEESYKRQAKAMSKEIRRMEKTSLKLHKAQKRDLSHFRGHLVNLMAKIDGLTTLSDGHGKAMVRDCQDMSRAIVECSAGIVRAEVDIFDALARKGCNGGGLDDLLEKGRDLFVDDQYVRNTETEGDQIFANLPSPTISVPPSCANPSMISKHDRTESDTRSMQEHDDRGALPILGLLHDSDDPPKFSERNSQPTLPNRPRPIRPSSPTLAEGMKVGDPLVVVERPERAQQDSKDTCANESSTSTLSQDASLVEACDDDQDFPTSPLADDDDNMPLSASDRRCNVF
ncbi:hypothetical protein K3495_g386 [Podosphaera aphanis]|nr:hypothetical protein K3495_g386 [Podosphaera aphanis]